MENYRKNIGKRVQKTSINPENKYKIKPFKSGFKTNTVRDVIDHPILHIPAYTFHEDDSYVECRRCKVVVEAEPDVFDTPVGVFTLSRKRITIKDSIKEWFLCL